MKTTDELSELIKECKYYKNHTKRPSYNKDFSLISDDILENNNPDDIEDLCNDFLVIKNTKHPSKNNKQSRVFDYKNNQKRKYEHFNYKNNFVTKTSIIFLSILVILCIIKYFRL